MGGSHTEALWDENQRLRGEVERQRRQIEALTRNEFPTRVPVGDVSQLEGCLGARDEAFATDVLLATASSKLTKLVGEGALKEEVYQTGSSLLVNRDAAQAIARTGLCATAPQRLYSAPTASRSCGHNAACPLKAIPYSCQVPAGSPALPMVRLQNLPSSRHAFAPNMGLSPAGTPRSMRCHSTARRASPSLRQLKQQGSPAIFSTASSFPVLHLGSVPIANSSLSPRLGRYGVPGLQQYAPHVSRPRSASPSHPSLAPAFSNPVVFRSQSVASSIHPAAAWRPGIDIETSPRFAHAGTPLWVSRDFSVVPPFSTR